MTRIKRLIPGFAGVAAALGVHIWHDYDKHSGLLSVLSISGAIVMCAGVVGADFLLARYRPRNGVHNAVMSFLMWSVLSIVLIDYGISLLIDVWLALAFRNW